MRSITQSSRDPQLPVDFTLSTMASSSTRWEGMMIQGIAIDVQGTELIQRVNARAAHHEARALACEAHLGRLRKIGPPVAEELSKQLKSVGPGAKEPFTEELLERKIRQHRERAQALTFLGQHVVPDEIYRVTETDLRAADLLPDLSHFGDWLW
jgi:hypothetical protein